MASPVGEEWTVNIKRIVLFPNIYNVDLSKSVGVSCRLLLPVLIQTRNSMAARVRIKTSDVAVQRQILDNVGSKLGIHKMEDWYHVTSKKIVENGGTQVLSKHRNSLIETLKTIYPNYAWKEYLFDAAPRNYWDSMDNQRNFIEDVGKKLGVEKMDDWYNLTEAQVRSNGGNYLLTAKYKSNLYAVLSTIYPGILSSLLLLIAFRV